VEQTVDETSTGENDHDVFYYSFVLGVICYLRIHADKVALLEFARRTPLLQQSINISCPPGPQQQTCSSGFAAVGPYWDRQTDGHRTVS